MELLASLQDFLSNFFSTLSGWLWGVPMIVLLLGAHIYMTFRTSFFQRKIGRAIKLSVTADKGATGDISQFASLAVAMAATIGTGNIIGVGTAVALGGPGAIFWCWLTGVFGIATKYSETLLATKYRIKTKSGKMLGGPMVVLDKVMKRPFLSAFFCVATAIAAFGIGNMSQANSVSTLMEKNFQIDPYISGLVMALLVALVLLGGVTWIAQVCKILVPFMAIVYIIGCLLLLGLNFEFVGQALYLIITSAFSAEAIGGGFAGGGMMIALRYGVARGLFSNESGMGSAPIVASAAKTRNAVRQAMVASTATFWDTVVICALTGTVLVTSVLAYPDINFSDGPTLTSMAFGKLHAAGSGILTIALLSFVFSTLLGWAYYGERSLEYLWGARVIKYYRVAWVLSIFVGSVTKIDIVWNFSDCANAMMIIPNLIAVLALSGVVANETRKYLWEDRLDDVDHDMVQ